MIAEFRPIAEGQPVHIDLPTLPLGRVENWFKRAYYPDERSYTAYTPALLQIDPVARLAVEPPLTGSEVAEAVRQAQEEEYLCLHGYGREEPIIVGVDRSE